MAETELLVSLAVALIAAALGGATAVRLGQPPILGYVLGGVLIGPYVTGVVADSTPVAAIADIGLAFLLFAVGLQLSLRELLSVGWVAVVGCALQVAATIGLGYVAGVALGVPPDGALVIGAFASISSPTVMAKLLGDRGEVDSSHGALAMSWATAQDLITIVLVVLLSTFIGDDPAGAGGDIVGAIARAALFVVIVVPLGLFGLPWLLRHSSLLRNREVFVLSVVAAALGTAFLAELFGLSLALGAFLAGVLVGESELSYHALGELAPLRDVFAGLFFVFVGMLLDPSAITAQAGVVVAAVALIVPLKGALSAGLAAVFRVPGLTAVMAGAALAQAGEFSFLLARLGAENGALTSEVFSALLTAAVISILIAPSLLSGAPVVFRAAQRRLARAAAAAAPVATPDADTERRRFVLLVGFGRVGRVVATALDRRGLAYRAVDVDPRVCNAARKQGVDIVQGSAENPRVLERAGVARAAVVVVALPDPIAMRHVVDYTRRENERVPIIARARTAADREFLVRRGVSEIAVAEVEVALEITRYTLGRLGVSSAETAAIVQGLRRRSR